MKKIKIGICGWGTVATALHRSILRNKNQIKRTHQVDLEIVAIGARRDNPKYNPGETKILRNIFDVLDEDIDVLVELIGGLICLKMTLLEINFCLSKACLMEHLTLLFLKWKME